ncbi:hypothetical protein [Microbulbifer sp. 2205BS26-8]|uniref:hypothetical protein n=1 Tax=Microbulbifer sp. 2205BS26-8 TaxID=3064386 RepID=UPI00273F68AB|nr:hypothetical protein [Microbulbifer sp. 2205BS26-8]MDP5211219.1 hypothetical protein [Microbulbifer sp. 2205BS26-8]
MKKYSVTYIGGSPVVYAFGCEFQRGVPIDWPQGAAEAPLKRLSKNRFFVVKALQAETGDTKKSKPPESTDGAKGGGDPEIPQCEFPTDSKVALEAWAKANLGLELDKRKSLINLIAEVETSLAETPDGDN